MSIILDLRCNVVHFLDFPHRIGYLRWEGQDPFGPGEPSILQDSGKERHTSLPHTHLPPKRTV